MSRTPSASASGRTIQYAGPGRGSSRAPPTAGGTATSWPTSRPATRSPPSSSPANPPTELEEFRAETCADGVVRHRRLQRLDREPPLRHPRPARCSPPGDMAAESFLAHCAALSGTRTGPSERFDYVAGPIAARYLVQTRVVEWWLHGEDMRATNGLGPQCQHWPIYLTIDMAVRMLPWSLGTRRPRPAGVRRACRSTGGRGRGTWHWGLGSGEVPAGREEARRPSGGRGAPAGARRRPTPQGGRRPPARATSCSAAIASSPKWSSATSAPTRSARRRDVAHTRCPQARSASRS